MVVELRHRADRRARRPHGVRLVDRDRRRDAFDAVDLRLVHAVEELARIRRERLDVAALALGIHRVERQRRLARARHARHHDQLVERKVEIEAAQIVLPRPANADHVVGHGCSAAGKVGRRGRIVPKRRRAREPQADFRRRGRLEFATRSGRDETMSKSPPDRTLPTRRAVLRGAAGLAALGFAGPLLAQPPAGEPARRRRPARGSCCSARAAAPA